MQSMPQIFDLGVADVNGDGLLDIFTSNHNYRQVLLVAEGKGGHRDMLTEWGLDQNRDFPGWEQSFTPPIMDRPGLYVYWLGDTLVFRTHRLGEIGPLQGTLRMFSKIMVKDSAKFDVAQSAISVADSSVEQAIVEFTAKGDGHLFLAAPSRGVPTAISVEPTFPLSSIFIGNQKVAPTTHDFSPFLRDRHALAWADVDADGQMDLYISRGGLGGTVRKLPSSLRQRIQDELFTTRGATGLREISRELGIEKKDCSGRHAEWVDFDHDGRLDLFINCQDRGKSEGIFPKQLWRQLPDGRFQDVAMEVGLGLHDRELIDFVWMDADNDGDVDLLTSEDKGFFLHRNDAGRFAPEKIFRPDFVRADVADLKGEIHNYWRFDGKLAVADFDADGDLDVFSSSKRGNLLLVNEGGHFRPIEPAVLGLPTRSVVALWVDYDNDGRPDLFTVPDGLHRQMPDGRFAATNLLVVPQNKYQSAIAHWYDRDNDGKRDLLLALNENPSLWRWWQKPFRDKDDGNNWTMRAWRNKDTANNWLQFEIRGAEGNRQAIGARVTVTTPDGTQSQEVGLNDSSFFSQGHYRLYYGLGPHDLASAVTVRWQDGRIQKYSDLAANQLVTIDHPGAPGEEEE